MIHPQLEADCHRLGKFEACTLLLHRNASLPWFILVPDTGLADVLDLPPQLMSTVLQECTVVSRFIKQELGFHKVNFAGLGNVVPQMHLHVIGRAETDACWPQPVWGNLQQEADYSADTLQHWQQTLAEQYALCVKE
ncbi:MAG: HIT family protein [Halieaceae bacterium]